MSLPQRISSQVPEFVRADHPAFLEFLKAYYTWLTTEYSPYKIEDVVDIDNTVSEFLQYFKKELDINGILQGVDNRTYLRHIKELYAAKGSTAGIEFLFKILYGAESSVEHPWDYVFKPSNGEWYQDISILVTPTTGNINGMLGNPVIITDDAGVTYQTVVSNINTRRNGVVELFIGRFSHEAPLFSVKSLTGDITATILQTTVKGAVQKRGTGFRIGQVFKVNSYGGSGSLIKVKAVDANGGITAVELIGFGTGYVADFNLLISPTNFIDPTTLGARITLGGLTYKTNDTLSTQNEGGSIVRHDYTNLSNAYMTDPSYVGETVGIIQSQPGVNYIAGDYASIKITVGHICVYPGYYKSSNNLIGDLVYIEDSYYYQAFSYVTVLEKRLQEYSDVLKRTLHPAGTKHFGNYQIFDNLQLSLTLDPSLNLISKADAIRDFIITTDDFSRVWTAESSLTDLTTATDVFSRVWTAESSLTDLTTTTDVFNRVWTARASLADSATITDVIEVYSGTILTDTVVNSENIVLDTAKYNTDVTTITSAGALYMEPYYVEVTPESYWQAGYLENEREFTN